MVKSLQNKAKNIIKDEILPAFEELEEFLRDYYRFGNTLYRMYVPRLLYCTCIAVFTYINVYGE